MLSLAILRLFSRRPDKYAVLLAGRIVEGAIAVGGMVGVRFSGGIRFVFTGGSQARYIEPGGKLPQKHPLLIAFDDESCLVFCVQMYGMLWAFPDDGTFSHDYYLAASERPNLYSETFTEAYFGGLAADPALRKKSVKTLLATEQRIPGLGNGVLQDMLLTAGIHPKRKVSTLNGDDIHAFTGRYAARRMRCCGSEGGTRRAIFSGTKGAMPLGWEQRRRVNCVRRAVPGLSGGKPISEVISITVRSASLWGKILTFDRQTNTEHH